MIAERISAYSDEMIIYNHEIIKKPSNESFGLHTHDICEIIYFKSGDVSAVIGGKTYKLQNNSIVVFRPHVVHAIKIDGNADYERYDILFDEKLVSSNVYNKIQPYLDVINFSGNNIVTDIFKKIDYYYNRFGKEDFKNLIYNLLCELLYNLYLESDCRANEVPTSVNSTISRAIDFIDNNYTKAITVNDISEALFVSKRHLHFLFIEQLNITPKKYINSIRLLKAQNLIRMGIKPNKAYCMCGFSEYATFYRNYINYFGHPPSKETNSRILRKIRS